MFAAAGHGSAPRPARPPERGRAYETPRRFGQARRAPSLSGPSRQKLAEHFTNHGNPLRATHAREDCPCLGEARSHPRTASSVARSARCPRGLPQFRRRPGADCFPAAPSKARASSSLPCRASIAASLPSTTAASADVARSPGYRTGSVSSLCISSASSSSPRATRMSAIFPWTMATERMSPRRVWTGSSSSLHPAALHRARRAPAGCRRSFPG